GTLSKAGFKGAILTAKHHDGFCLWPSEYTQHSVQNSKWKNGKGDVVKAISDACHKYGLKFGIYLSPWDRNHAEYGNSRYISYYRNQLTELMTNYGDIFEVWFDGANGGDGYYGGANENRFIDRANYYAWDTTMAIVRKYQSGACMFSDAGPDIRWVGNEHGHANDSSWATYTPTPKKEFDKAVAGTCEYWKGETGTMDGKYWIPAETDVSIRPGWFYHASEDSKVKSLEKLVEIYFSSVGNGTSLNLNIPPNREGKIHSVDSTRLMELKNFLDETFKQNVLEGAKVSSDKMRGELKVYSPENVIDNNPKTYWTTDDEDKTASIVFDLKNAKAFNCLLVKEYISLGQRVFSFSLQVWSENSWQEVTRGTTIGYKKLIPFDNVQTSKIKFIIHGALACPVISEMGLYQIPGNILVKSKK
ncbi:MAG: alpha-L-fucosidase, partial [Bacteroidota bacterium]|nr:alpha-L-fucosidase [Bacteroidota bacterium]